MKYLIIILLVSLTIVSCDKKEDSNHYPTSETISTLETIEAEKVGMDQSKIDLAYSKALEIENLYSLLIVKNGFLVAEDYFDKYTKDSIMHIRSVTKSVVSALIGKAIEEGFIESINDPLSKYISEAVPELTEEKGRLTLKELITMSSGLEWNESWGNEYYYFATADDPVNYVLDKPFATTSGTHFNYNSGTSYILSVVLTEAVGKSTLEYAEEKLFAPLNFENYYWYKYGDYYNGGASLMLRARDMAKFGMLYLNNGKSNNVQLIPEEWISESLEPTPLIGLGFTWGDVTYGSYGYQWWLDEGKTYKVFYALGWGGQIIYCVPDYNLVVVATSVWNVESLVASSTEEAIITLITDNIIPSINN